MFGHVKGRLTAISGSDVNSGKSRKKHQDGGN